jgi:hypothetical protein
MNFLHLLKTKEVQFAAPLLSTREKELGCGEVFLGEVPVEQAIDHGFCVLGT